MDPFARAAAHVRSVCDRGGEARVLRQRILTELGRAVPHDAYVWPLTDPETSVGTAPLADVPGPLFAELPSLIRLKYLTDINRWTTLDGRTGRLHAATGGDLTRSLMWRESLRDHGVVDVASSVYRDRFGCWGFLDLWRLAPGTPFTDAESAFLARVADPVTAALRRSQARAFVRGSARERRPEPVVLLLSPDLEVLGQTPQTHEYLRLLVPPPDGEAPVPASAYNVAGQLCALESHVDSHPAWARVSLPDGQWLNLRAARLSGPQPSTIAVTIEDSSPTERIGLFARAFGLSPREAELLGHLPTGADTRALALELHLSEHTVQDHLKSIFAKTETRTRQSLLSLALGT